MHAVTPLPVLEGLGRARLFWARTSKREKTPGFSSHHKEPASSLEHRAVGVLGFGVLCPSEVMHGPANSLHKAVNSGAAAAAALQALCNAGLWSLLQINTICSGEHVSFLHDTHSLLPRWQHGERQRGPGKGGKMWPRPFLTPTHSLKLHCLCGGRALVLDSCR